MKKSNVTVIGSYNVGLFLKGQRLPVLGETIIGDKFYEGGGGKGSNQAIASSCFGVETNFIGRIGNDKYGQDALTMYDKFDVSKDNIFIDESIHSGISVILIDKDANNLISVIPGANFNLSENDINKAEDIIKKSCIVGFQLENNFNIVEYAIKKAHNMGVKTLLDPAPAIKLPEELYKYIDIIKPNETEATILTGIEVTNKETAEVAANWFLDKGVKNVIITLGSQGVLYVDKEKIEFFKGIKVKAIDSTGAGDIFSGALMSQIAQDKSIDNSINFANHAAALSVTKLGVIESIPTLKEVENFTKKEK